LLGLFKKVLIADNLSFFVQGGFAHPELFTGLDLWLFAYAFAFQIYFDFSGYTDIARGSAKLFGYKVPINFNLPYLASNIAEFWHRWHISLSTWLRDYLFIPLGGSRCSSLLSCRNLIITMALGGLWHGASMHFVIWGLYHGSLLVVHREFKRVRDVHCLSYCPAQFRRRQMHLRRSDIPCSLYRLGALPGRQHGFGGKNTEQNVHARRYPESYSCPGNEFTADQLPAHLPIHFYIAAASGDCPYIHGLAGSLRMGGALAYVAQSSVVRSDDFAGSGLLSR
jgi:hypothetical protein